MTPRSLLLVFGTVLGLGCGEPYCESSGLVVAIWNPPAEISNYVVEIEFDNRTVMLACAPEMSKPGICETTAGSWKVSSVFFPVPPPDDTAAAPITLNIERGDDFSSYVPQGEVRVVLTSPTAPEFHAEHMFVPEIEGSPDCQFASENWDLTEEPTGR